MRREEPDRVPLFYRDVPEVGERLQRDLGLPDRERLLAFFEIDFRWVEPRYVGPSLADDQAGLLRDIWGVTFRRIQAGRGTYLHAVSHPLGDVTDPAALADYPWPQLEWFDFAAVEEQLGAYAEFAVMTAPNYASPGILTPIQHLVGEERAWTDMMVRPAFFEALVERILAFELPFLEAFFDRGDGRIDFFRIGDDFGTQQGLLMSPALWRDFLRPALAAMSAVARQRGAYYYHHSCGSVRDLIPAFIDLGVDVLDPVQVTASGMEPAGLKRDFGDRLCFSGGVDEQRLLVGGTPEDVREQVKRLLDVMAPGGGFFLGPTHNLQADVPTENVVAMYEAARDWRYATRGSVSSGAGPRSSAERTRS
jgi:uroporphyrinogen decarboxylase